MFQGLIQLLGKNNDDEKILVMMIWTHLFLNNNEYCNRNGATNICGNIFSINEILNI